MIAGDQIAFERNVSPGEADASASRQERTTCHVVRHEAVGNPDFVEISDANGPSGVGRPALADGFSVLKPAVGENGRVVR